MTKNVELHLHKWSKMKGALGSVTETGSGGGFSGGSYSSWGGPAMSSYSGIGGSNSQGFANRIKSLVEITEKAKRAINELDVDGAIGNLHFHDDHVTAISLQSKLTALETYAGKVQQYLKDKIDQPFYEKLDKVGDRLEALNISDYKTSNQIGFKKTEVIYSEAGQYMGTREVLAKEVGLKELYQVDNPYKTRLQAMYDSYKSSDDYKESKLTEEDYLFASHQTRAFTYHSLNDEKAAFEGKRDLLLAAGVVILSIFCPPAGAVAGVALAAADMYSAASGKDWMTGRELDDGERLMRGAFALFDLVPGVGYLNDLAKTGKVAGFAGIKASLKTSFKEGMEQAAKNVDNFKVVLKNVDDFGKKVVTKIDDFGKQLDNLVTNKVSSLADNVAGKLRHADETISTAAQNFRLNIGLEPQLIDGFMPTPPPGKLSGLADNIQAFAKNLDGSVDEVMESGAKTKVPYGEHIVKGKYGKKQLLPDIQYVSEQGYKYTTDSLGRIVSVEADELILDRASRNLYSQRTIGGADRLADDDGGHLIASMFKGSGDIDNLVAMHKDINRSGGVWFDMEQEWKKALSEVPPKKVSVNIEPIYANGGLRPTEFKVRYYIEGNDPMVRRIINQPGG
ncbi:DNA/RNA non-specific endonuclease [Streptococcus ruminantium]|uniref:DNA/RNA non-specific endonuclease n=1 Tax=Streptococcus ruminantium TaxID=1917441 RepID=UPI0012DF0021|nr:DNA/RNA non-specific endonuclease [Streptococcus ruminantium]